MKGWAWTIDQYLETIPALPGLGQTFLMNCYASLADVEHQRWGTPGCNRWWEPLPESKRLGYEAVVRATHEAGLEFWFSMNPNLFSDRFATVEDVAGIEALWAHYAWMQRLGVRTFNVSLDDIGQGSDATGQARLVNELLRRLRAADPSTRMVFTPTIYWGDATAPSDRAYLAALDAVLDPDVAIFWTGDAVITPRITRAAGERYRAATGRRRLVIWDNYPCNDAAPTMHLGPLIGRDPDLAEVADGYMNNPMATQHRLSLLPIATAAEYAMDPRAYDPARALDGAIERFAATADEQAVLRDLVDSYPGMLVLGANQYFDPVRDRFSRGVAGAAELDAFEGLVDRFRRSLGRRLPAELETLEVDLAFARRSVAEAQAAR
jgi:hypothetical protein